MSLHFAVGSANGSLKLFARVFHVLQKISDDVSLTFSRESVHARCLNASHSAYAALTFRREFFDKLTIATEIADGKTLQVQLKCCVAALRSANTSSLCRLSWSDAKPDVLEIVLDGVHGVCKRHGICTSSAPVQRAVTPTRSASNVVVRAKDVLVALSSFSPSTEEITLVAQPDAFHIKTFVAQKNDSDAERVRALLTDVELSLADVYQYQVGDEEASVSFGLGEFKAALMLADFVAKPLEIAFTSPGKPLTVRIKGNKLFDVDVVLATIVDAAVERETTHGNDTPGGSPPKRPNGAVKSEPMCVQPPSHTDDHDVRE